MNAKLTQFPCFAYPTTQEVKLGAAYLAATRGLYVNHIRRMNQKPSLHTLVRDNSSNQEGFVDARATPGYDHPRENLDAYLLALFDAAVDVDRVANVKLGQAGLQMGLLD